MGIKKTCFPDLLCHISARFGLLSQLWASHTHLDPSAPLLWVSFSLLMQFLDSQSFTKFSQEKISRMNKTINPTPTCSEMLRTKKRSITKDFQRKLEIMNWDKNVLKGMEIQHVQRILR